MGQNEQPEIAVIIPVHNRRETTLNCLRQLQEIRTDDACMDIVIVDDGSTDGTAEAVMDLYPDAIILSGDGSLWWTGAINVGVRFALEKGYNKVLIMNDDLELDGDFLKHLLDVASQNPDALVSSVTVTRVDAEREEILTAGFKRVGILEDICMLHAGELYKGDLEKVIRCDFLTGASLLVPVNVFMKIGLFDDRNFPHNWGDFEFTLRASLNGYPCLVASRSKVYTEYNLNYPSWYFFSSTRRAYLLNLFNSTKFLYGFRGIRKTSYMHRSFVIGTLLYLRRMIGLIKSILLKLLLPRDTLRKYLVEQAKKSGAQEFLINKLKSAQ